AWESWGFAPTYYACFDPIVYEDNSAEIGAIMLEYPATQFFLPQDPAAAPATMQSNLARVSLVPGKVFSNDLAALSDFGNVGATSVQILAGRGYRRIAMVGIDARYRTNKTVDAENTDRFAIVEEDLNHFSPEYGRGKRIDTRPDLTKLLGRWPQVAM